MPPSVASMVSTLYSLAGIHDTVLLRPCPSILLIESIINKETEKL